MTRRPLLAVAVAVALGVVAMGGACGRADRSVTRAHSPAAATGAPAAGADAIATVHAASDPSSATGATAPAPRLPAGRPATGSPPTETAVADAHPVTASGQGTTTDDAAASALPVEVSVTPSCVAVGGEYEITVRSAPRVAIGLVVAFSDGAPHGAWAILDTDDAGTVTWKSTVAADAPAGEATVRAGAMNHTTQEKGSAAAPMTVAALGGCR